MDHSFQMTAMLWKFEQITCVDWYTGREEKRVLLYSGDKKTVYMSQKQFFKELQKIFARE